MEIEWENTESEYELRNPPDFITHLNYVTFINTLARDINISYEPSIRSKINISSILNKKINLIKLTLKSIKGEYKTIQSNPDYAELCVSWISVKAYYLIFNLLLILEYLLTGQDSSFGVTHKKVLRRFKKRLERNEIYFNKKIFNSNFQCSEIMVLRGATSGANLKIAGVNTKERAIHILKKLTNYKLEDFKREIGIKNFRHKKERIKRDKFLKDNTVNICEFFYWYRIKANYRDLEFLNKDISNYKFVDYYKNYYELTLTFYRGFQNLINDLARTRFNKEIL